MVWSFIVSSMVVLMCVFVCVCMSLQHGTMIFILAFNFLGFIAVCIFVILYKEVIFHDIIRKKKMRLIMNEIHVFFF